MFHAPFQNPRHLVQSRRSGGTRMMMGAVASVLLAWTMPSCGPEGDMESDTANLSAASAVLPLETVTVSRTVATINSEPMLSAKPLAQATDCTVLIVLGRDGAWLQVRWAEMGITGWIHETAVSTLPRLKLRGPGVDETYHACEVGAGRKG